MATTKTGPELAVTLIRERPAEITLRLIYAFGPGILSAEIDGQEAAQLDPPSGTREFMDNPDTALMGAQVVLAALGYELDRDSIYQDVSLMVATFRRSDV